jgi:FkbM family methyltransferase
MLAGLSGKGVPMPQRPRYGALPPLLSGVLASVDRSRLATGIYSSGIAEFDLDLRRLDLAARAFALRGFFEWRIAAVAALLVDPGDIVFEGGAHLGTESFYYCALVGPGGKVVSFEADAFLAERLRTEAERQRTGQLVVKSAALGPQAGISLFDLAPPDSNSGLGALSPESTRTTGRVEVEVATLDDAMAAYGSPKLLVMDIQGGELGALRGADRLLAEARPAMVMEVESGSLRRLGGSAEELLGLLRSADYRCWRFTRLGLRAVDRPKEEELDDWLVLPRERADRDSRKIRRALALGAMLPPGSRFSPLARLS